jgi:hypothetical protein
VDSKQPSSNFRKLFKTEEEWIQFKKSARSASHVLEIIAKVVENERASLGTKAKDFDIPGWPYYRAFQDGEEVAYNKINQYLYDLINNRE